MMQQVDVSTIADQFRGYLDYAYSSVLLPERMRCLSLPLSEAAKEASLIAEQYLMKDERVRAFIEDLRRRIGFTSAPLDVCVEYAARQTCQGKSLPKDDPELLLSFYKWVVLPCMQFRSKFLECLSLNHPELSDTEKMILRLGFYIAQEFDRIFRKWWEQVIVPYRTSVLPAEETKELIKIAGKTNMYSVLVQPDGSLILTSLTPELIKSAKEIPLAEAFPEEVSGIRSYLLYLINNLPTKEREYCNYFQALYEALGNRDLAKMERHWLAVDETWVKIGSDKRVIPVHMMEKGYHDPFRISPEYRVMLRLTDFADVIAALRQYMKEFAGQIGDETDVAKIDAIDIGVFHTVVNGGCGIDFRYAGQSVPNRPKAQEIGMKIFLDGASMATRFERHKHLLEACLDEATWDWVKSVFRIENMYALVAGHEFGHPLLINPELVEAFGEHKPKVEEGKATLFGIAGIKKGIDDGQWGPEAHLGLSVSILAESLRMMEKNLFYNPTFAPYVNEAMMIFSVLKREGLLVIADGKLHMYKGVAGSGRVAEVLYSKLTLPLIDAYRKKDLPAALKLLQFYADRESEEIKSIFKVVNTNLEQGKGGAKS